MSYYVDLTSFPMEHMDELQRFVKRYKLKRITAPTTNQSAGNNNRYSNGIYLEIVLFGTTYVNQEALTRVLFDIHYNSTRPINTIIDNFSFNRVYRLTGQTPTMFEPNPVRFGGLFDGFHPSDVNLTRNYDVQYEPQHVLPHGNALDFDVWNIGFTYTGERLI